MKKIRYVRIFKLNIYGRVLVSYDAAWADYGESGVHSCNKLDVFDVMLMRSTCIINQDEQSRKRRIEAKNRC